MDMKCCHYLKNEDDYCSILLKTDRNMGDVEKDT